VGKSELFLIESLKERWRSGSPCGYIKTIYSWKFERKVAARIIKWVNHNYLLLKVGKKVGAQDHHVGKSKLFTYRYN
jgi:hypothetical protein